MGSRAGCALHRCPDGHRACLAPVMAPPPGRAGWELSRSRCCVSCSAEVRVSGPQPARVTGSGPGVAHDGRRLPATDDGAHVAGGSGVPRCPEGQWPIPESNRAGRRQPSPADSIPSCLWVSVNHHRLTPCPLTRDHAGPGAQGLPGLSLRLGVTSAAAARPVRMVSGGLVSGHTPAVAR